VLPNLGLSDIRAHIRRDTLLLDMIEVAAQGRPGLSARLDGME